MITLALHILFCLLVFKLVSKKGYDTLVSVLVALCGLIGLIIYFFLPDRSKANATA